MERWKHVRGFEGLYKVSDKGHVASVRSGKILKPRMCHGGYLQVTLCRPGATPKGVLVHRLVASAFVPNPMNKLDVNHLDEVKTNNAASNLEWCTRKENINWGTRTARCSKQVKMLDKSTGELLAEFPSTKEAERRTGIAQNNICACCRAKLKTAGGYVWKYI